MDKQLKGFEQKYGYLVFNKKYYHFKGKDGKPILVEVKKEDVEKQIKTAEELAKELKEGVDTIAVLTESLMKLSLKDLEKLHNLVFKSKRNYKPRTRTGHCVDMKIGKFILPLVD